MAGGAYDDAMTSPEMLAIGLPTLSVLVGILLNRNDVGRLYTRISNEVSALRGDIHGLRGEMNGLRGEISKLRDETRSIRDDQREFYRSLGEHEIRLDNLEKK
jgi:chromosome segregation ATPase